ncbi:MAG: sporulation protein [Veillonellaceae bacterium]|nr:sporulation protein [Veillonellaceae bacterium]
MDTQVQFSKEKLEAIFDSFKRMVAVDTVVGEPVRIGDTTLVPFVDVAFGFGTGMTDKDGYNGGGGGGKLTPTAVLVIKGDRVEMFSVKDGNTSGAFEKILNMAPEIIDKLKNDKYIYIREEDE